MILTPAMIEKALQSYHRDAGGKPPRKGSQEWQRQATCIANIIMAISDDLRQAVLLEAVERARPRSLYKSECN